MRSSVRIAFEKLYMLRRHWVCWERLLSTVPQDYTSGAVVSLPWYQSESSGANPGPDRMQITNTVTLLFGLIDWKVHWRNLSNAIFINSDMLHPYTHITDSRAKATEMSTEAGQLQHMPHSLWPSPKDKNHRQFSTVPGCLQKVFNRHCRPTFYHQRPLPPVT